MKLATAAHLHAHCVWVLGPLGCVISSPNPSSLLSGIGSDILSAFTSWVASGAAWLLTEVGQLISTVGSVDLGEKWFSSHYQVMAALAGSVAALSVCAAVIESVLVRSGESLVRALVVRLPVAAVVMGGSVAVTQMCLRACDELCAAVTGGSTHTVKVLCTSLAHDLVTPTLSAAGPLPGAIVVLCATVVSCASLALIVEMIVRASAIYIVVLFIPVIFAISIWPRLSRIATRLIETLFALIFSKFVVVAVLVLGASELEAGLSKDRFTDIVVAMAMLIVAALSPYSMFRLLALVEISSLAAFEGHRQRAMSAGFVASARAAGALRSAQAMMPEPDPMAIMDRAMSQGSQVLSTSVPDEPSTSLARTDFDDLGSRLVHHHDRKDARETPKETTSRPIYATGVRGGHHVIVNDSSGPHLRWVSEDS